MTTLARLAEEASACRACPLWREPFEGLVPDLERAAGLHAVR